MRTWTFKNPFLYIFSQFTKLIEIEITLWNTLILEGRWSLELKATRRWDEDRRWPASFSLGLVWPPCMAIQLTCKNTYTTKYIIGVASFQEAWQNQSKNGVVTATHGNTMCNSHYTFPALVWLSLFWQLYPLWGSWKYADPINYVFDISIYVHINGI